MTLSLYSGSCGRFNLSPSKIKLHFYHSRNIIEMNFIITLINTASKLLEKSDEINCIRDSFEIPVDKISLQIKRLRTFVQIVNKSFSLLTM